MIEHRAEVWRESRWPYQWIGQCRGCHRGIRCNDRETAVRFLQEHPVVVQVRANRWADPVISRED